MRRIRTLPLKDWTPSTTEDETRSLATDLEEGCVLYLPELRFALSPTEKTFIDTRWADPKAKNLSYDGRRNQLAGALGTEQDRENLLGLLVRYRQHSLQLIESLFPAYVPRLRIARTSLRLQRVEGRETSWRKDDSRLHVDAFPSQQRQSRRCAARLARRRTV
jgi:hypothetical protein